MLEGNQNLKISRARSSKEDLGNEHDESKKAAKFLAEKSSNECENLLGKFRVLWQESRKRDIEEDDSALEGASRLDVALVENVLQKSSPEMFSVVCQRCSLFLCSSIVVVVQYVV